MYCTPSSSIFCAMRSLSSTVSVRPSIWAPSRSVVSKSTSPGGAERGAVDRLDVLIPFPVGLDLAARRGEVGLLQLLGDGARLPGADHAIVDLADRGELGRRAREEALVRDVRLGAGDALFADLVTEVARDRDHRLARDAVETGRHAGRGDE